MVVGTWLLAAGFWQLAARNKRLSLLAQINVTLRFNFLIAPIDCDHISFSTNIKLFQS